MAALILLSQAVLIGTFGLSAVSKVYDRGIYLSFRRSLPATLRIPSRLAPAVAALVVAAEVIIALLLVAGIADGRLAPGGLLLAAALLAAFTAAVALMLKRRVTEPLPLLRRLSPAAGYGGPVALHSVSRDSRRGRDPFRVGGR